MRQNVAVNYEVSNSKALSDHAGNDDVYKAILTMKFSMGTETRHPLAHLLKRKLKAGHALAVQFFYTS